MSKENVELWDKILRAFRRASANSDWEAWISRFDETLDPDVEWDASDVPIPDLVGTYRGIEAVAGWWRKWLDAWETVEFDYELVDAGDRVVLLVDQKMRGSTGMEVTLGKYAHVATFRDGLMIYWKTYTSQSKALEAAGVRE